jgi:hypothetical protein
MSVVLKIKRKNMLLVSSFVFLFLNFLFGQTATNNSVK